jgi:signal peptidase I
LGWPGQFDTLGSEMRKLMRFLLWTALILGALIGVLRWVAIRWWRIPENDPYLEASIAPTLHGGDLIVLWRASKPGFGDLVLCPEPNAPQRVVIGRIVGESNDRVLLDENGVTVNNKRAATERACGDFTVIDPKNGRQVEQRCDIEDLAGNGHKRGSMTGHNPPKRRPIKRDVPAGQIFLLSDNRLYPYDSRDFGLVDRETCKETVVFRLVSKNGYADQPNRFNYIQ